MIWGKCRSGHVARPCTNFRPLFKQMIMRIELPGNKKIEDLPSSITVIISPFRKGRSSGSTASKSEIAMTVGFPDALWATFGAMYGGGADDGSGAREGRGGAVELKERPVDSDARVLALCEEICDWDAAKVGLLAGVEGEGVVYEEWPEA